MGLKGLGEVELDGNALARFGGGEDHLARARLAVPDPGEVAADGALHAAVGVLHVGVILLPGRPLLPCREGDEAGVDGGRRCRHEARALDLEGIGLLRCDRAEGDEDEEEDEECFEDHDFAAGDREAAALACRQHDARFWCRSAPSRCVTGLHCHAKFVGLAGRRRQQSGHLGSLS